MAGNVTGLHRFADDVGPIPLSLLDTNFDALTQTVNTLATFSNFYVDTGTTNALTISPPSTQNVSYSNGLTVEVQVAATNTGASTLNIGTLGPQPIQTAAGAALTGGELQAGAISSFTYNASRNAWQLGGGGGGGGGGSGSTFTTPFTVNDTAGQAVFKVQDGAAAQAQYGAIVTMSPGNGTDPAKVLAVSGMPNYPVATFSAGASTQPNVYISSFSNPGSSAGNSNGVWIAAGTNASDAAFVVENAASVGGPGTIATFFIIHGDGSGALGPAPNQLVWNSAGNFSLTGTATLPGGGSGGVSYLSQLLDVSVSAQTNGQVLTWNSTSNRWVNQTPVTTLAGLSDVSLSSPAANQVLTYNGVRWVNAAPTGGALATLSDVAISAATAGQFLSYNGSKWVNSPPPTASLAGLSDVTLSGATAGQVLSYNGSRWINSTPSGGGSGGGSPFTAPFYVNDTTGGTLLSVAIPSTSGPTVMVAPGNEGFGVTLAVDGGVNANAMNVWGAQNTAINSWVASFHSGTGVGFSNGVFIQAGTNANDLSFMVEPAAGGLQYFIVRGDGSGILGAPSTSNMTWGPTVPFTCTSVNQSVPALVVVTPPKTIANLWTWELGGGGPSGSAAGCANGLRIAAGTNASDAALLVRNDADTTTYMQVKGDGSGSLSTEAWSATGVWTIGPSTDPNALQVVVRGAPHTTSGLWFAQFGGGPSGASTGCSNGLYLGAGTNAADVALWVQNDASSSTYFIIYGDGSGALGPAPNQMTWDASGNFKMTGSAVAPHAALSASTDIAISNLQDGQTLVWNAATSRWTNSTPAGGAGSPAYIKVKATPTSLTNAGTMANDPDLVVNVPAAGTYWVKMIVLAKQSATGNAGIDCNMNFSGTCSGVQAVRVQGLSAYLGGVDTVLTNPVLAVAYVTALQTYDSPIVVDALLVATSAGTVHFSWSQDTASTTISTTVGAGSCVVVEQLA